MAKSLTNRPLARRPPKSWRAESTVQALREANFKYEAKRRDLEDKFGAALASLREQDLAEVSEIHGAEAA